jgi:putative FmdB family regulatory protein
MPTYEYVCTSCGHRLEAVQSFSDSALTTCPVCQGALRKVFGNVGIVLKGSGFYKTDSRTSRSNGSGSSPKEKESTTSRDSGSKDSGSKDSGSKDSGSKDSGSKDSGSKDSGSTKDAPASTPSSSPSSGPGGSEKANASSS